MPAMRRPQFVPSTRAGAFRFWREEPASTIGPLRADCFPGPAATRPAAPVGEHRRTPWRPVPAQVAAPCGCRIGRAHSAARREAHGAGARGLLPDRPAPDRALRRARSPRSPTSIVPGHRRPPGCGRDLRARDATGRSAVRAGPARRGSPPARPRHPGVGAALRRPCLPQALEHLHGVRDETATRALISQENRRYARRQLIWFRKEPDLTWLDGPGESPAVIAAASRLVEARLSAADVTSPFSRAIVIVLDGVGIGELPDAGNYGDRGSDTLANVARQVMLSLPTLRALGLDRLTTLGGPRPLRRLRGLTAAWRRRPQARTRSPDTGN